VQFCSFNIATFRSKHLNKKCLCKSKYFYANNSMMHLYDIKVKGHWLWKWRTVGDLPAALFHVTWGLGNPSALHSTLASLPWANALSVGSKIHLGGTVCKARHPSVIHSDSLNDNYLSTILLNLKRMKDLYVNKKSLYNLYNYGKKNHFCVN
jgi:hypothetical protein